MLYNQRAKLPLLFCLLASASIGIEASAQTCLEAHLTGVGGPPPQPGKAQSGVFVRYGSVESGCNDVKLQFDAGRGVLMRLSQISAKGRPAFVTAQSLDALFITHGHSDHTSSLPDIFSTRWVLSKNDGQFDNAPPPPGRYTPLPTICFGITCQTVKNATRMWDRYEIPHRKKNDFRLTKPKADMRKFKLSDEKKTVWQQGDVSVSAISVAHIEGSVGYRVNTPAGSVCISGDTALSENLKTMCQGADVMIHEATHPVIGAIAASPPDGADPKFVSIAQAVYDSHTDVKALPAFDESVSALVMTHLTPGVGAGGFQGVPLAPYLGKITPGRKKGPLRSSDFCQVLRDAGYQGTAHLGVDLMKIRVENGELSFSAPADQPTDCNAILTLENAQD